MNKNKEMEEQINNLAWKIVPLPSGCSNCWGDLHEGCTDECRRSDAEHTKKIEEVKIELHKLVSQAEDNMRKRCVEALPKERNLNTKFPTFGVNRESESWIRGFNVALDQATQNIKELKKKT